MKLTRTIKTEHTIKTLLVEANVRYWEDATLNGVECTNETTDFPCQDGGAWKPHIDVETGVITNWRQGCTASIHFKTCDENLIHFIDDKGERVYIYEGYVPKILCPAEKHDGYGHGDYIIMDIDENGKIDGWESHQIEEFDTRQNLRRQ